MSSKTCRSTLCDLVYLLWAVVTDMQMRRRDYFCGLTSHVMPGRSNHSFVCDWGFLISIFDKISELGIGSWVLSVLPVTVSRSLFDAL